MLGRFVFFLLLSQSAFAVLDGQTVNIAATPDDELIQRVTIRLVTRDPNGQYRLWCSGVITGPSEITSAGHCLTPPDENPRGARMNDIHSGQVFAEIRDPKTRKMQYIQIGDARGEYSATLGGRDIALLKLTRNISGGVSIPMAFGQCDGKERFGAGFGLNENGEFPSVVKIARYSEVGPEEQSRVFSRYSDKPKAPNTAIAKNGKLCAGDSGGPIFCKVHGRLALDSLVSTGLPRPVSLAPPPDLSDPDGADGNSSNLTATNICRMNPYMTSGRIANSLGLIKSWRQQFDGTDPSETVDAQK